MPKVAVRYMDYFAQTMRRMREDGLLLATAGDFTVNVPPRELAEAVAYCGTVSGRDRDKFLESRLTPVPSKQVHAPIIRKCVIHYGCRTLHRNDLAPDILAQAVQDEFYAQGDYHRVYFGEIVAVYADEDAAKRL